MAKLWTLRIVVIIIRIVCQTQPDDDQSASVNGSPTCPSTWSYKVFESVTVTEVVVLILSC